MEKTITSPLLTSCLWFNTAAEEAVTFYTDVFKDSKTGRTSYYTEEGFETHGMPAGSVLTIEFEIGGQSFLALNGGPHFKFNEAVSFVINCKSQEEVDYYWNRLTEGGDPAAQMCGWLKDKYGLSWQVVPTVVNEMMLDPDKNKVNRVMAAILKMRKLDIKPLEEAYAG
jgi:predicted 3-demethylubiquinone-9 3-methyltransferase (glyoxalase superfamily)